MTTPLKPILEIKRLTKEYIQGQSRILVLKDCSKQFVAGNTYAITGISGSGKSTLLYILAGLEQPTQGGVFYNEKNIALFDATEQQRFLNETVGLIFQQPHLISELTVVENVLLPAIIGGKSLHAMMEHAYALLADVGLAGFEDRKIGALSGGQQTRVAIARALCNHPQFILADEPTGNLDVETGSQVLEVLKRCQERYGTGLIISTHDEYVAEHMAQRLRVHEHQLVQVL